MKRILTAALFAALTFPAGAPSSAKATEDKQDQKVEEGYTSLFNGKDLSGWVYGKKGNGENKSGAGYAVENGVIFCKGVPNGFLRSKNQRRRMSTSSTNNSHHHFSRMPPPPPVIVPTAAGGSASTKTLAAASLPITATSRVQAS